MIQSKKEIMMQGKARKARLYTMKARDALGPQLAQDPGRSSGLLRHHSLHGEGRKDVEHNQNTH
jgi:hypothetical protein